MKWLPVVDVLQSLGIKAPESSVESMLSDPACQTKHKIQTVPDVIKSYTGDTIYRSLSDRFAGDPTEYVKAVTGLGWREAFRLASGKEITNNVLARYERLEEFSNMFKDGRAEADEQISSGKIQAFFGDWSIIPAIAMRKMFPRTEIGVNARKRNYFVRRHVDTFGRDCAYFIFEIGRDGSTLFPIGDKPTIPHGAAFAPPGPDEWPGEEIVLVNDLNLAEHLHSNFSPFGKYPPVFLLASLPKTHWEYPDVAQRTIHYVVAAPGIWEAGLYFDRNRSECRLISGEMAKAMDPNLCQLKTSGIPISDFVVSKIKGTPDWKMAEVMESVFRHSYMNPCVIGKITKKMEQEGMAHLLKNASFLPQRKLSIGNCTYFINNGRYQRSLGKDRDAIVSNFVVTPIEDKFKNDHLERHVVRLMMDTGETCLFELHPDIFESSKLLWRKIREEALRLGFPRPVFLSHLDLSRLPAIIEGTIRPLTKIRVANKESEETNESKLQIAARDFLRVVSEMTNDNPLKPKPGQAEVFIPERLYLEAKNNAIIASQKAITQGLRQLYGNNVKWIRRGISHGGRGWLIPAKP